MARALKKSESLEIRIPHATKAAFMSRCRADGASASETLRSFIEAHLAQPGPAPHPRTRLRLAAGVVAALGLGTTALPSLARPLERAGFEQLDADRDGALAPAEFARVPVVSVRIDTGAPLLEIGGSDLALDPADPADRDLRARVLRRAFGRLDRDGDGALSFREFRRR